MTEPAQLVLDLPHRAALGAEDFLVSGANAAAVDLVDRWPDWALASALVVGPERSGKSHLAHVWRLRSKAPPAVAAASLDDAAIEALTGTGALVVEDLDRGIGNEQTLFHLLNAAREHRAHMLLTSARPPGALDVALPDLRSRLRALPVVAIQPPDEELLKAVMVKLFADRQLAVDPLVIEHLSRHMERSFATATELVARIDQRALATKRRVTRALATEILSGRSSAAQEDAAG